MNTADLKLMDGVFVSFVPQNMFHLELHYKK